MELSFVSRGRVKMDDVRLARRNFSGTRSIYNNRSFLVVIPTSEMANDLINAGWDVRIKESDIPGEDPFMYLPVTIRFNAYGPRIALSSNGKRTELDEESVDILDNLDYSFVGVVLSPYKSQNSTKETCTAYLHELLFVQEDSYFGDTIDNDDDVPFEV